MEKLDFNNLSHQLSRLEQGLKDWRFVAPDIHPVNNMSEEDIALFIKELYALGWESLCISGKINTPPWHNYVTSWRHP